jgi:acetyltransferase
MEFPGTLAFPDFERMPGWFDPDYISKVPAVGLIRIRPLRQEDEREMIRFHAELTEESVYCRYFNRLGFLQRTDHARLSRVCVNTAASHAVAVERTVDASIIAVGRLDRMQDPFAVLFHLLAEDRARDAVSEKLLKRLIAIARALGFTTLVGDLITADEPTLDLVKTLGFTLQTAPEREIIRATLVI